MAKADFFLLFQLHFSFFSYTPVMKGIEASASNFHSGN